MPDFTLDKFYFSNAHVVAILPAALPKIVLNRSNMTEKQFRRIAYARVKKHFPAVIAWERNLSHHLALMTRIVAGDVNWALAVENPCQFFLALD